MKNVIEPGVAEMEQVADDLFSIIPGADRSLTVPVCQADTLSENEFWQKWVSMNTPCLIKGAVKHWPAVKKWKNKNYWIASCGNDLKQIITHMNYYSWERRGAGAESMHFHDAIERLFQGDDYIFSIPAADINKNNLFAGVLKDTNGFSFLKTNYKMPVWDNPNGLYIYRRASTAWHVHNCDETLMCQVNGAKIVALLPRDIPRAKQVTGYLESEAYLKGEKLNEDLDLKLRVVVVEEGDSLYIPPHWFHCVVPQDGKVGFTFVASFKSPWHTYGNLSNYFVRRLYKMTLKSAPFKFKLLIPFWCLYATVSYCSRKLRGKQ